jgi:hypothetical protein
MAYWPQSSHTPLVWGCDHAALELRLSFFHAPPFLKACRSSRRPWLWAIRKGPQLKRRPRANWGFHCLTLLVCFRRRALSCVMRQYSRQSGNWVFGARSHGTEVTSVGKVPAAKLRLQRCPAALFLICQRSFAVCCGACVDCAPDGWRTACFGHGELRMCLRV